MAKLSGGKRSSWKSMPVFEPALAGAEAEARFERGKEGIEAMLAVVLADIGIGILVSAGEGPLLILDVIEPAEEMVDVRGIDKLLLLVCCALDTTSESDDDVVEPLLGNPSVVDEEDILGEVTRDSGCAADEEAEELGLDDPFKLDTIVEPWRFFMADPLLDDASSGTSGIPADLNCGYAESCENQGSSSSASILSGDRT